MLNKGFLMVDLLIVLTLVSLFNLFTLNWDIIETFKGKINISEISKDILLTKNNSILNLSDTCLDNKNVISRYEVCYNRKGNINKAQTINSLNSHHKIVVHLGSGVYEVK